MWHGVLQLVEELGHKWQAVAEALGNVRSPVQCKEHWRLLTQQAGAGEEPVVFTPEQLVELKEVRHQGGGWQGEGGHHVYDFDVTSGDGLLAQPLVAVFCLQFMGCSMDLATSNGACNPVALACHARSAVDVPLCRYLHVHTVVAYFLTLSTVHPNLCLTCPPPPHHLCRCACSTRRSTARFTGRWWRSCSLGAASARCGPPGRACTARQRR